ncbi:hypothetical protein IVB27_25405 [Bradyrhizobium sp. 197]|uniref:hypothetical protein n=1 Tax=Bradyrhizobium sp. 197 TaxID=2782663 RepID=UPI001FF77464|nr:hypothetical protein [Bradyrhizobium sp. 197]MCK1478048.1 hypothetical protein [Bradyrhizobium sp. 197]
MTRRLTDTEIAARIVPTVMRWPADISKTIAWDRLRECVDALRGLVFTVNGHCLEAEHDGDLSPDGIFRRRTQLGQQALAELADFTPFQTAEKAVASNLVYLEERMVELPKPTTNSIEFMLEQEIRVHIRRQKSRLDVVVGSLADRRFLSAVINAPAYLSGLTEVEWNVVRERARAALHPQQSEMQQWLNKALAEVRDGLTAAKRMLLERCELREDGEGQFRPIRQPASTSSRPTAA